MTLTTGLKKAVGHFAKSRALTTTSAKSGAAALASNTQVNIYNPKPQEEDSRIIRPKFWTGRSAVPLEKFNLDCSKFDFGRILVRDEAGKVMADPNCKETEKLVSNIREIWDEMGFIQLKKTGLTDYPEMQAIAKLIHPEHMQYEAGANQRSERSPAAQNVYDVGAPEVADLHYHHEMAYVEESTKHLTFCCKHAMKDKYRGATFVGENLGATKDLMQTKLGEKLAEKGLCYIRKLPDQKFFLDNKLDQSIVYNFWQTSMMTEDPEEAIQMAQTKGLDCEWQDSPVFGRYLVTKFNASCFEYDPITDRNQLFASIADDYNWFNTWPGVGDLPHWEQPLKLNFGDGEVMTREEKQLFVDVYARHGVPIWWEQGDIASICNWRTAHGRPGYFLQPGEKRELGVMLGEQFTRVGERPDKWKF